MRGGLECKHGGGQPGHQHCDDVVVPGSTCMFLIHLLEDMEGLMG